MMKFLEIRDSATFIPAIAFTVESQNREEEWLLSKAGFGKRREDQNKYIFLCRANNPTECHYDYFAWPNSPRTMPVAHKFIEENWDIIKHGDVIDVEFILKETSEKKKSERLEDYLNFVQDSFDIPLRKLERELDD